MGVAGVFSLINAGITIGNGIKGMSSGTSSDLSSYGLNELGVYLEGADASEEAFSAAENFLKDNPFLQTLFPDNMDQVKEDSAKVESFEKEVKTQEFFQAKEMADAKINSSQQEYYDKELTKKLDLLKKDFDPASSDYQVRKEKIMDDHKAWIRQRELDLLEAKQQKEDQLRDAGIKRRENFFNEFTKLSKEGYTEEANKKRMDLVKSFQENEAKFALTDQQDLLKVQGTGFPKDSNVNEIIKGEASNFEQISKDYTLPDGARIPDDVKQAYNRMEEFQKKMYQNLEKWTSGDLSSIDDGMKELRSKFLTNAFGNTNMQQAMETQISQFQNFMEQQQANAGQKQQEQPNLGVDLSQFKFDNNSFWGS